MVTIDQCAQCGQADDHPKVRLGDAFGSSGEVVSMHLDCLPYSVAQSLCNEPGVGALRAAAIDAAESGTHGDDLRALLVAQTTEGA
jgi:hypothetical protein